MVDDPAARDGAGGYFTSISLQMHPFRSILFHFGKVLSGDFRVDSGIAPARLRRSD